MRGLASLVLMLTCGAVALAGSSPSPAMAAASRAPQSVRAEAAKAQAAYDNALRNPDVRRIMDDRLSAKQREIDRLRQECDDARARLTQANGRGRRDQAEIERLTREVERLTLALAEAQAWFVDELARRDRTLATEIALYRGSLDRILETPEGLEALERINAGDIDGGRRILDNLNEARAAARRAAYDKRRNIEDAADLRATAMVLLGREPIAETIATFEKVVALDPDVHWDWVELSRLYVRADNLDKAEEAARRAAETAESTRDEMVAWHALGDIEALRGGNRAQGRIRTYYARALKIAEARARDDSGDAEVQRDLSVSYLKLGDVYAAQPGGEPRALELYGKGLAILEDVARGDPGDFLTQRDLVVTYTRLGDVYSTIPGSGGRALELYERALLISETLARANPDSSLAQRDLSVSYIKLGDAYRAQPGGQEKALELYNKGLAHSEAQARKDPGNLEVQRDMSVGYSKLGDVHRAQPGGEERAIEFYGKSLAIFETLSLNEPENRQTQRDLSVGYTRLGDVYRALPGGRARALELYDRSIRIAETLARSDPGNAVVQRDLLIGLWRMAALGAPGYSWQRVVDQLEMMDAGGVLQSADRTLLDEARRLRDREGAAQPPPLTTPRPAATSPARS